MTSIRPESKCSPILQHWDMHMYEWGHSNYKIVFKDLSQINFTHLARISSEILWQYFRSHGCEYKDEIQNGGISCVRSGNNGSSYIWGATSQTNRTAHLGRSTYYSICIESDREETRASQIYKHNGAEITAQGLTSPQKTTMRHSGLSSKLRLSVREDSVWMR